MDNITPGTTDFAAETVLDNDIQFPHPVSGNASDPEAVLLTGASGFFGAYLTNELLHKTRADIYCLIRCKGDTAAGKQRLENHLRYYSLWNPEFASRIIPISGDLSLPLLGLSEKEFAELAARTDAIYHNGALVNGIYPYSALKKTNVGSTKEILRLAGCIKTKPVHFVSTVAVFFSDSSQDGRVILETDIPKLDSGLKGGYKQSKCVAEKLVMTARDRGLPVCIFRTARIMGHSKSGITRNFKDFLTAMMKACILLGKFPGLDTPLYIVPADYAAGSLVYLSLQKKSAGKVFHILNSNPVSWTHFFEEIRGLGYAIEKVSAEHWLSAFRAKASGVRKDRLYSVLRFMLSSPDALVFEKPNFDAKQTIEGLNGSGISCPATDRKLLSAWLSYFQRCGYLPAPNLAN
jgi:thioester reductase-like protein